MKQYTMRHFVWIYGITLAMLVPAQIHAQGRIVDIHTMDSIVNPSLLKSDEVLRFDKTEMNVGHLSEDDAPVAYRFHYRNVSKLTVTLVKVSTSCGCTVASFSKNSVKPGEEGEIILNFNPNEQAGTLNKSAYVYTNLSQTQPTAKISLIGKVLPTANQWVGYPSAMGNALRLKRAIVSFKEMTNSETRSERLACVNSGNTPLKLSALMIPRYAKLRTEPSVIPPGMEADIVITIDGSLLPPTTKSEFSFPVIIDGIHAVPSDRTIRVKVTLHK